MSEEQAAGLSPRVVVLSGDGAVCAALAATGTACAPVATAYEAAAELLAGGASALVIDLRLLWPRHMRLLQIARQRGVRVLAVGGLPAGLSAEDLSGVRLLARADLPRALAARKADDEGRYEPDRPAPPAMAAQPSVADSVEEIAATAEKRPAPSEVKTPIAEPAGPPAARVADTSPGAPRAVLSSEELRALLEDGP